MKAGASRSNWCHPKFDDLVVKAAQTEDISKRTAYYKEAQQVFKEEVPWVTIAHAKIFRGMSKRVKNYKIDPLGSDRFDGVDLR